MHRWPEALKALKSGFSADWQTGELAILLGLVARDLGDDETAERALTAVTTQRANGERPYARVLALHHLARIAQRAGDAGKAKMLASRLAAAELSVDEAGRCLRDALRSAT